MSKLSLKLMMSTMSGYQLLLIIIRTDICDSILCHAGPNCECTDNEPCRLTMNCNNYLPGTCEGANTLTCRASQPCSLLCIGEQACANSTLVLNGASSVSLKCIGGAACGNITVDSDCAPSTASPIAAPTPAMHAHVTSLTPTTSTSRQIEYAESNDDNPMPSEAYILFAVIILLTGCVCCLVAVVGFLYYNERKISFLENSANIANRSNHRKDSSGSSYSGEQVSKFGSPSPDAPPARQHTDALACANSQPPKQSDVSDVSEIFQQADELLKPPVQHAAVEVRAIAESVSSEAIKPSLPESDREILIVC